MNIAILIQAAEYLERRERGTVLFNYYFTTTQPVFQPVWEKSERYLYFFSVSWKKFEYIFFDFCQKQKKNFYFFHVQKYKYMNNKISRLFIGITQNNTQRNEAEMQRQCEI